MVWEAKNVKKIEFPPVYPSGERRYLETIQLKLGKSPITRNVKCFTMTFRNDPLPQYAEFYGLAHIKPAKW
jgi:hypothetical protein